MMICNGLFTSGRTLEQVFNQELAYLDAPIGTADGGDYVVDRELQAVAVGAPDAVPVMRADAYSTSGTRGQYVIVVPSHDVVIVRRGLDFGQQGFDRWDLTRVILKAIPPASSEPKLH